MQGIEKLLIPDQVFASYEWITKSFERVVSTSDIE